MPKEFFTSVTMSESVYRKAEEKVKAINEKAGYRKYRSIAHFIETAVIEMMEKEK